MSASAFELPPLPYAMDALAPHISQETLEYHYGKHHQGYVNKLNKQIPGSEYEGKSLEEIVTSASGGVFNNAAQVWNHSFYWQCLSPNGGGKPVDGPFAQALVDAFGSIDAFVDAYSQAIATVFGSGWAWLVKNQDGKLEIVCTKDAGCPITDGLIPILTCDVWEHAYYIDYRNSRPNYIEAFWQLVNWDFAAAQFAA
ncbi:superoxide dismutase [Thecamonas trahens ATCC 50062]|uniref:Superoxide dismutase n=1 Tax=Thecamonas trahens ATCC 50062 TaxID=461836 RepID=A0A0L0DS91_THETB|nr:superoxide dismutase [Thecamonas trahens ATCC 50062]KNC55077.1 superoxide dismutase [Thecamonas trahens ATCC 50062]|eukprot:XP_013753261.1 superoxide dismutase [Thecamonas trahens ATCC 50062]